MIVVDTGPLVALLDADDQHHDSCRRWLDTAPGPLLVPVTVLVETAYFVERDAGPSLEADFLRSFDGRGPFQLVPIEATDLARMAELIDQYADWPLGAVDASVITIAERVGAAEVATLDHRHFSAVRPRHVRAFTIVPD